MSSSETRPPATPDDALPPVQPPDAGFLVQLFVIPGVIVLIILAVWGGIHWLASSAQDPESFVRALSRPTSGRWQTAHNLADVLRHPGNSELRRHRGLALQLGSLLESELAGGDRGEESIKLQVYVCHALGQFELPEVVGPLAKAASGGRDGSREPIVRVSALRGLALFADRQPNLLAGASPNRGELADLALGATRDQDPVVRSTAIFLLGAVGGGKAAPRLRALLRDPHPNVRYNAATMLARRGDAAAIAVLVQMLDPEETAGIEIEPEVELRREKRLLILENGLRAAALLAEKNPRADCQALIPALEKLAGYQEARSGRPGELDEYTWKALHSEARRVLAMLHERATPGKQ
ncbi:MAG: HEAT repeat domain-containing protein [Pirellulales bacterium]|nr:HEAT repeat domain-containing protein [Pirellulales bacterium]